MAKQFVPVTYDGYVIGDGILFHLDEDEYEFVGRVPTVNWIQFHVETGDWNVELVRDDRSPSRPMGKAVTRTQYRFQIQGPNACAGDREAERRADRGHQVLPHGLHQHQGPQGARAAARHVRPARASRSGARTRSTTRSATRSSRRARSSASSPVGSRAYASNTLESGWIPSPLPAIYTGEKLKALPRVAARRGLRGLRGHDRRQLRLRRTSRTTTSRRTSSATATW